MSNPNYKVGVGETIRDVIINSTGSINNGEIDNWDLILSANSFDDWTPLLTPGQEIVVPDSVYIDANTLANRQAYPANNSIITGYLAVINAVWSILTDNWILKTGFWNDGGLWIDTDFWID